jgi:hypothetical protein
MSIRRQRDHLRGNQEVDMDDDLRWRPRVREQPPEWPFDEQPPQWRPAGSGDDAPWRSRRAPDRWEDPYGSEPYPGSTVLDDFDLTLGDDAGTARVLARYTVVRLLVLCAAGLLRGVKLRTEQRVATGHLELLPPGDGERRELDRAIALCDDTSAPALPGTLVGAAAWAVRHEHVSGAFALFRAAFHLAVHAGDWRAAADAAEGIARLARLDECHRSGRLWERRASVLRRRLLRESR